MELKIQTHSEWAVVYLKGRVDSFNYEIITQQISTLVKIGKKHIGVVVSDVHFMSLPCLRFFSSLANKLQKKEGRLSFIGGEGTVLEELKTFNVNDNYNFIASISELNNHEQ